MTLDQPLLVVQLGPRDERQAQLFDRLEGLHPQQLLLEGTDRTLDATVALWSSHEGGAGAQAQEGDLVLEVLADVLRAVVMTQLHAGGDLLADAAEATANGLANRLERLPARGALGGVDAEDFRSVVIDREQHAHRTIAHRPGAGEIRSPAHVRRRRNDRALVRARSSGGAATGRSPQSVLAHQAQHPGAAGADTSVAQLCPNLPVALAEKRRGSQDGANVPDELLIGGSARGAPRGPTGALIGSTGEIQARASEASESAHPVQRDNPVLGSRHVSPHLFDFPGAKGPCFLSYTRLISREISRFSAVSPSAFCSCVIFSSRLSTSRLFNPASPLARKTPRHDESVAALTFSSRESASRSSPFSRRSTAAIFFFEDHRPRSSPGSSFFLRIGHSSALHFGPKACPGKLYTGGRVRRTAPVF